MLRVCDTSLLAWLYWTPCMSVCLCCMVHAISHTLWLHLVKTNCISAGFWAVWLLCLCAGMSSRCFMPSGVPSHGSWATQTLGNPLMIFFMVSIHCWTAAGLCLPIAWSLCSVHRAPYDWRTDDLLAMCRFSTFCWEYTSLGLEAVCLCCMYTVPHGECILKFVQRITCTAF